MKQLFMVEFALPDPFPPDFVALIPQQRLFINEKMNEGIIKSYSLSLSRSKLWMTISAKNEREIVALVAEMPMGDWLQPEIHELMFHNTAELMMPFSLN